VLTLRVNPRQPAFVVSSEGEQAHAVAGWIALALFSAVTALGAGACAVRMALKPCDHLR
jgi:hypothetical protein